MPRKPMTIQFDLFSSPRDPGIAQMPQWRALPIPTRQKLMPLIVRLLRPHGPGLREPPDRRLIRCIVAVVETEEAPEATSYPAQVAGNPERR